MNLPNKLTMLRIAMVPVIVILLLLEAGDWALYAAGVLFILASLTDLADGKIARKYNLITDFGKFMDPLADKLLVCSVMIAMIPRGAAPAWAVILIIAREFAISGFRLVASQKGVVIAAGKLGKLKTNFQMFWIIGMLFPLKLDFWSVLTTLCMLIAVVLTVVSFAEYILANRDVLKEN